MLVSGGGLWISLGVSAMSFFIILPAKLATKDACYIPFSRVRQYLVLLFTGARGMCCLVKFSDDYIPRRFTRFPIICGLLVNETPPAGYNSMFMFCLRTLLWA